MTMDRPSTPPPLPCPLAYPLTPPPTGGFDGRDDFANTKAIDTHSRHLNKAKEGESPTAFFDKLQEGSDAELGPLTEDEDISLIDDKSLASPASAISIAYESSVQDKCDPFGSLAIAIDAPVITEPFPFLKLPLSVRNKVYEHLLVVPALICVRQKHTASHDQKGAYLYTERRDLLPGIAYALAQLAVNGHKARFSRFATTNINIVLASKEVHAEAKAVLYGRNSFEIVRPSTELTPPTDFSVRLFPPGCQRLITTLNVRIRSFYDIIWLLSGRYNVLKNYYRGLRTLTIILELDSASKGFGRQWAKTEGEKWTVYIKRLHSDMAKDIFGDSKSKKVKVIPTWINLRVMFSGESYDEKSNRSVTTNDDIVKRVKRDELRQALGEAWELFKKGGR